MSKNEKPTSDPLNAEMTRQHQAADTALSFIEKIELESGHRIDDNKGPAMDMLVGALARAMDPTSHDKQDDCAAGMFLRETPIHKYGL